MSESLESIKNLPDISFIENKTLTDIQSEMIRSFQNHFKDITGREIRLARADPYRIMMLAASSVIYQCFQAVDKAGKMNFLKYSYGDYLKHLAAFKNISAKEPQAAKVKVRWYLEEAREQATAIPNGSRVTADNEIYFESTEYKEIPIGQTYIDIVMTCTTTGSDGNGFIPGEINIDVDETPFIDRVENIETSTGGEDVESDDSIKERTFLAPSSYSVAGPEDAYIYWAKQYDSEVGDVYPYSPAAGVVNIRVLLSDGSLPGETLLIELKEYLSQKDKRPLTDNVVVEAPEQVGYNIIGMYYINRSDKDRALQIQGLVSAALSEYKTWQSNKIGRDINPDELIAYLKKADVKRVVLTEPEYRVLSNIEVASLETVSLKYGGIEDD